MKSRIFFRWLAGLALLAGLGAGPIAQAQTAPTWVAAANLGTVSQYNTFGDGVVDAAGNFYEAGNFYGTFTLGGTTLTALGNADGYLAKYAPNGTVVWVRQIGSTGFDFPQDVALDAAGNLYVAGEFGGDVTLGNNIRLTGRSTTTLAFAVRYSSQGTPEWAQQTSTAASGTGIGVDATGHAYWTGTFSTQVTVGTTTITSPGVQTPFLARLATATGALQTLVPTFYYLGSGAFYSAQLAVGAGGETYLLTTFTKSPTFSATTTLTSTGGLDALVAKYDAQGAFEWVHQVGGLNDEFALQGAVDAAGNLYVAGLFTGPSTFGNISLTGAGNQDGYLLKCSPQGTIGWVRAGGGSGSDSWRSVCLDAAGAPYVVGQFSGAAQYGAATLTSQGGYDAAVVAYTPQGAVRWAQRAGGTASDIALYLGLDANGDVHTLGRVTGAGTFGSFAVTAASSTALAAFLAQLGSGALATSTPAALPVSCYPNPATEQVCLPGLPAGSRVQLVDALGRVVREAVVPTTALVSVRGLAPGLYTLRATTTQGQPVVGRVVVE